MIDGLHDFASHQVDLQCHIIRDSEVFMDESFHGYVIEIQQ